MPLAAGPVLAADREDNRLGKRVEEQLVQDEKLRDYVLEAKADGGVVTLTGRSRSTHARVFLDKRLDAPIGKKPVQGSIRGTAVLHDVLNLNAFLVRDRGDAKLQLF